VVLTSEKTRTAACATYRPGAAVWVHRGGRWRPGIVLSASARAVTVRYRPTDSRGAGVDTATAIDLQHRGTVDALLDQAVRW